VGYYKWGPWVNGGAWIQTPTGKLDLLYRNIEQVQRVIDESQEGLYQHDYYQQPTFGFVSITYLAETKCCLPLFDPQQLLQKFKHSVEIYPAALQQKMIRNCLTIGEFTLAHAHGFADRGDILNTVGCLTKIAFVLLQSLFALNAEYYFGDKGSLEAVDRFPLRPRAFSNRLQDLLAMPMQTQLNLKFATRRFRLYGRRPSVSLRAGISQSLVSPIENPHGRAAVAASKKRKLGLDYWKRFGSEIVKLMAESFRRRTPGNVFYSLSCFDENLDSDNTCYRRFNPR
jgi:hypothetical protein